MHVSGRRSTKQPRKFHRIDNTCFPFLLRCRRKQREAKQYSKQVQAEKQKERTAAKKKQIESVTTMRKQREKSVSGMLKPCKDV